jgi:hypothetical protein
MRAECLGDARFALAGGDCGASEIIGFFARGDFLGVYGRESPASPGEALWPLGLSDDAVLADVVDR